MRRTILLTLATAVAAVTGSGLQAQTVPETSQAARVEDGYRRTPTFRMDPFRNLFIPHWGFVTSAAGSASNNTVNFNDIGALIFIGDNSDVLIVDLLDALGLVESGSGLKGNGEAAASAYIGGPIGSRLTIGVTVGARAYGGLSVDDDAVSLLRDGNGARSEFTLGDSDSEGLTTGEVGGHLLYRLGPFKTQDGAQVVVGAGTRYVRPLAYGSAYSVLDNGGVVRVTGDSIAANLSIETLQTIDLLDGHVELNKGGGFVADLLARVEWPTSGLAIEAMLANLGAVSIAQVERRAATVNLETTDVDEVRDVLDTLELELQEVSNIRVTLPRVARFSASAWANRILQLDVIGTFPFGNAFELPSTLDFLSTWRLARSLPLRTGLVFSGQDGVGFTAGIGVETRNFLFEVGGRSLGGLFDEATGASARLDLGVFF
jgi:hypothetical protein